MFAIVALLNVNYNILRAARNALVVADLGHGAASIPVFELFGTMPASVLMVYLLAKLLNRFSIHKVFFITLATFSLFFLLFATVLYPAAILPEFFSLLFFVMAELWKIALLTVLFWGLVNQYIPIEEAKKYYAPLMLGGSIGTILSGPLVSFCTSDYLSNGWGQSLQWLMIALSIVALLTGVCFTLLWEHFAEKNPIAKEAPKPTLSLRESIQATLSSRYLMLLAWITIATYIAYAVGETIFLEVLKQKFPNPRDYCDYMGKLTSWSGMMTAFSALAITPYILRNARWVVASIITPACILFTEGAFFISLWTPTHIDLLVLFGTLFFCLARAMKYTLLDSSKEISFLLLPPLEKMQGKLVIDGMCSRAGRAGASVLSISFTQICGSVLASAFLAGSFVLAVGISCLIATLKLGKLIEKKSVHV